MTTADILIAWAPLWLFIVVMVVSFVVFEVRRIRGENVPIEDEIWRLEQDPSRYGEAQNLRELRALGVNTVRRTK